MSERGDRTDKLVGLAEAIATLSAVSQPLLHPPRMPPVDAHAGDAYSLEFNRSRQEERRRLEVDSRGHRASERSLVIRAEADRPARQRAERKRAERQR
ncbi:MAG TPA: hypothetical protein VGO80_06650 [Solirubrobacteraceae bacterium]|jgi:hypothetical protein|nr:hypothetical protein [Solirubrobacteraceae bacterium]